jgi:SAM-dependent methyltransferase
MTALPFADGSFDAAISYGVFYYCTAAKMRAAVREMHRVLKPGGSGFVVVRTTADYRFGKGREVGPATFVIDTDETNEAGSVQHFPSEADVPEYFADFGELSFERTETTFQGRRAVNSDRLISVRK